MPWIAWGALILLAVAGCGRSDLPPLGRVEGAVTLDGRPVTGATVMFQPMASGRGSFGVTDATGHYALTFTHNVRGALLGGHGVQIFTAQELSEGADDANGSRRAERLPARYNRLSELTAEVRSGWNTIDFALESSDPTPRSQSPR